MDRRDLERLSRDELVARAERLGVSRPRVLTQPELMDEIIGRTTKSDRERVAKRGWLGRARDLLAGVMDKGLHLPDIAKALRATPDEQGWPAPPAPLPTITLAEIYAAQGHLDRALGVLDEVLAREPTHAEAKKLRERFAEQLARGGTRPKPSRPPPKPDADEATAAPAAPAAAVAKATPTTVAAKTTLPDRYDVDEVVAIAVNPTTVYLYWEVRATTFARARAARPDGRLVVRLVSVTPSWEGPATEVRDVPVDELYGDLFVRDLTPGANVRTSVGWIDDGHFEPFAVGVEIAAPRAIPSDRVSTTVAKWTDAPIEGGFRAAHIADAAVARMLRATSGPVTHETDTLSFALPHPRAEGDAAGHAPPGAGPGMAVVTRRWRETRVRLGGASDLVRDDVDHELVEHLGGPGRPGRPGWGGASDLARGGASDLVRGGASDLARLRRG